MSKDNLPVGKAVLSLGVALDGPVLVDLTKMPHMLIGGSTGSGKTFLVLSLIKQALDKAMQVYILDMKGGVDYPRSWKGTRCSYNDSRETILSVLSQLVDTLEDRKLAFGYLEREIGKSCPNIDTYNRLNPKHAFSRVMVVCDELAEVTDTTGMDKPNKELVNAIVGKLGTLARLGRAFGIHLVMALQRPDASALPGQIKNNADVRACGRADNVLSTIIMDNGDAADLPKDIPGRFITNLDGGTIFQGYMLPDLDDEDFDVNDTGGHDDGSEKD
jgi:S-DNA-T family DNA segregation ATPase FtsK/SpoIIIE